MDMPTKSNTALLVLSCDKYADIWPPFFDFLFKFWNDCPYPIYLGSNEKLYNDERVKTICSGPARDWSNDTLSILKQIPEQNVIILLEDYFVYAHPDQLLLDRCIALLEKMNGTFLRLACFPSDHFEDYAYDVVAEQPEFVLTRKEARYRVNLQAGIWNRLKLMELIVPGESPWAFETEGTKRSREGSEVYLGVRETNGLRYVHGPILYLCTALSRGVWMRDAIDLCKEHDIKLDIESRPVESVAEYRKRKMYHSMPYGFRKYWDYIASKLK
jgi:hypothetical protein